MNINKNISIVYDTEILNKIKEMIQEGFDKLKNLVNSEPPKFNIYDELKDKFNDIENNLKSYDFLNEELTYLLLISDEILYIINQNCKDSSFGHCDFALELFDFFIEIWNAKIRLIENYSEIELKKHETLKSNFKKRYHTYRREFYWNIYEYSEDFDEKEMYEFAKSLKE
ncbi:MAG: hypothetical protein IJ258_02090 [Methanobrevibacter sp.]|uniref:hypothetical protein n=1 Tax=Methanobrevibacter sp. TaxID=66852 RepID=UPI0025D8C27A|nr:hypothetical protein [Methanobrevibacter sp.]MBQ8016875.1 hypothetical protein [Methanobrevibacter sp.]